MRCAILISLCAAPFAVPAETLHGTDDPAFKAALQRLLTTDDPAAIADLRGIAADGNTAAVVALSVAETWFPIAATQSERLALRKIAGHWISDLAAAAAKTAGLWQGGAISPDLDRQLDRALDLYNLGEAAKGDGLLEVWFNHYPHAEALPHGFADLPAAPWIKALIVEAHIAKGEGSGRGVLQSWLDRDQIEGWMALAALIDRDPATATGWKLGPNAPERLQAGRKLRALLWQEDPKPPLPAALVDAVLRDMIDRPQFAPVRAYCAAACPGTASACAAAFVTVMGQPFHDTAQLTPPQDLIPMADFFATPRGEQALLRGGLMHHLGLDRHIGTVDNSPALAAARQIDACFADGAMRALATFPASH